MRPRSAGRPGLLVAAALTYLVLASAIMIWRGISVSPDYIFLLLLPIALASGRWLRFLGDWIPFVGIFLGWEAMRGMATKARISPHIGDLAHVEQGLFGGHVPTAILQSWTPPGSGVRATLALVGTVVYFCHFVMPLGVGMALWLADRRQFLRYTTGLLGMAFAAFVIFLLIPTAPPWYAARHGAISGATRLTSGALPSAVSPYYRSLNPNEFAAFPSLHAAFPFLCFLALRPVFPRASWLALAWSVLVWITVVYLGEHYVVDVVGGIALATASWTILMRVVVPRVRSLHANDARVLVGLSDPRAVRAPNRRLTELFEVCAASASTAVPTGSKPEP